MTGQTAWGHRHLSLVRRTASAVQGRQNSEVARGVEYPPSARVKGSGLLSLPYFEAEEIRSALPFEQAIWGIEQALLNGMDPEEASPRLFSPAPDGEFLLMPISSTPMTGCKVATIAPKNPDRGLAKIQAVYLLFDAATLAPLAMMEGTELTAIRTPATTLTAVKHIAAADPDFPTAPKILVFGAGVQGLNHIRAARAVYPEASFGVVGRSQTRLESLIATLGEEGANVQIRQPDAAAEYDIILCVTSSSVPVFDGNLPQDHTVIASVGQHGLDSHEVDASLVLRADITVEGRASSWQESGNLAQARSINEWRSENLPNIQDLVAGRYTRTLGKPALFTGVGMAWEDLALASVVYQRSGHSSTP